MNISSPVKIKTKKIIFSKISVLGKETLLICQIILSLENNLDTEV